MQPHSLLKKCSTFALLLLIPATSFAASIDQILKISDTAEVSRGTFIRAAVQLLEIPMSDEGQTTFSRPLPKSLAPYVHAADHDGALAVFGKNISPGKAITRGEAVTLLVRLQGLEPSSVDLSFGDIAAGSMMESAARVAIEKNWLTLSRPNFFGAAKALTGTEAKLLLRKASGDTGGQTIESDSSGDIKVPVLTIRYKKREVKQLPQSDLLRTIWQLLSDQYLYVDKLTDKEAAYKAAEGLVQSVGDQYTTFMRPSDAKHFQEQIEGEISGIGAQVEYKEDSLIVIAPISGSPAEKAGLKAGDIITAVDGKSLAGSNLNDAVDKVRGPRGSEVTLTVKRDGSELSFTIKRDTVKLPEIDISYQGDIAIVKLAQFGQTTDRKLRSLLIDVQNQDPKGIILDLRNNPGGLLHAAEIVVSNFLPQGSGVAMIKSRADEYTETTVDSPTIDADVPLIVLINKGSASASEIVAGALQDSKRAKILGETSYGKGTVQQIIDFNDGSSMKMTIAEWLTPKGRKINGVGVTPDIAIEASDGRDEVLLRAIDMLR